MQTTSEKPKRYPRWHPLYVRQVRRIPSKYRGVRFCLKEKKWRAKYKAGRTIVLMSYHDTEIEAARAYDRAAVQYKQDRAIINFPEEQYEQA